MDQKVNLKSSIQSLGILLEDIYKELSQKRGAYQPVGDLMDGNFHTPAGLIVPMKMYRYVYENYELFILNAYIKLFQSMLRAEDEIFIQTAFRIQQELGIKKIDVFFSNALSPEELKKIKLICILSDWILTGAKDDRVKFEKLFNEEKSLLDSAGQSIFEKVRKELKEPVAISTSILRPMTKYRDEVFKKYSRKIPTLNFISGPNLSMLYSYWSELLHGNPFMLEQIFNEKLRWRSKNRLYAILWFTGQHAVRRLQTFTKKMELRERIEAILKESDQVWQRLTEQWKAEAEKRKG